MYSRLARNRANQCMKSPQAFPTIGNTYSEPTLAGLVDLAQILVILGPVDAQIDHCCSP